MKAALLLIVFILVGCSGSPESICKDSGGEYVKAYPSYCDCPKESYTMQGECVPIAASDIKVCEALTNNQAKCAPEHGVCVCVHQNTNVYSLSFEKLNTQNCECDGLMCTCYEEGWI